MTMLGVRYEPRERLASVLASPPQTEPAVRR
jgi:hypothetical protein